MREERDKYVSLALKILQLPRTTAQTIEALEKWWRDETQSRVNLDIVRGTSEYDSLVAACAERKAQILAKQIKEAA